MKSLLSLLLCSLLLFGCSDKYDDSALRNDLNDLENRVAKLEELCKQMNTNISSLQKIVEALQDNLSISKVEQISDGYIIYFSDGSTATIKNGKDSGDAPVIGVKQDTDGCYYWTLDGEWLTDEKGNKVKAQGTDGKDGVDGEDGNDGTDGEDGITPQLKIEDGRWMLSMDDGKTWTDIGQATGADGKDGEDGTDGEDGIDGKDGTNGIFKSVTEDDDNVYFTLEDDSVITIPKSDNSKFAITFDTTDVTILNGGESKTISYTITDATENTVVKAIAQDGWKAKVNTTSADKGTITITAPNPIVESEILVFANDGSYRTVMASLNCAQGQIIIADNSIDISSDGGTKEIKLTTNLDYSVEILDDAKSWLSLASNTRAMREDTITFNIAANEGITRFATVILKEKCGNPLQTIIFKQLGNCTEIQVDTQGTLATLLADYDLEHIKALKIKGEINSEDFLIIRQITNLSLLDISETTLSILPDNCLNNCKITSISLPPTLKIIGAGAFAYSQIKDITIPANVQIIGDQAFRSSSLKSIFFEENSLLQRIGKRAFYSSLIASFTVPSNVETIESEAFSFCQNLLAITFAPNGRLTKIIGGITQDERVFSDSKNLQEINNIPASVKSIYPYAFKDTKLQIITFEKDSQLDTINYWACPTLQAITIPKNVKIIKEGAFAKYNLKEVNFESNSQLTIIEGGFKDYRPASYTPNGAFYKCINLSHITIPANVEEIGPTAFIFCTNLQTVKFETNSKLKKIGGGYAYFYYQEGNIYTYRGTQLGAFNKCSSLLEIEIPTNVEIIPPTAFYGCSSLKKLTFGNNSHLKEIQGEFLVGYGEYTSNYAISRYLGAFNGCDALTHITFPASLYKIGIGAFANCQQLSSIDFEDNAQLEYVESYGEYPHFYGAFSNSNTLRFVDMSSCRNVKEFGEYTFYKCNIDLFKIGALNPPSCEFYQALAEYSILKVPTESVDIYKQAKGWNKFSSVMNLSE